jgi:biotin carboxyl carrier protein
MAKLDSDLVRQALSIARKHGFAEVELGVGDESFTAKLEPVTKKSRGAAGAGTVAKEPEFLYVTSSLVGYYREAPNALKPGLKIQKGDIVAVVNALGIRNDVESKVTGEVVEVLVEPNQPVEYGQILAKVKP